MPSRTLIVASLSPSHTHAHDLSFSPSIKVGAVEALITREGKECFKQTVVVFDRSGDCAVTLFAISLSLCFSLILFFSLLSIDLEAGERNIRCFCLV